jgi:hypothetical protein
MEEKEGCGNVDGNQIAMMRELQEGTALVFQGLQQRMSGS